MHLKYDFILQNWFTSNFLGTHPLTEEGVSVMQSTILKYVKEQSQSIIS